MSDCKADGRAMLCKQSGGQAIAPATNVCFCPPPPPVGPVPVPLPNWGKGEDLEGGSRSVMSSKGPFGVEGSTIATSMGDALGQSLGGGILSKTTGGALHFHSASFRVHIEGRGVLRGGDVVTHNHAGASAMGNTPPNFWLEW